MNTKPPPYSNLRYASSILVLFSVIFLIYYLFLPTDPNNNIILGYSWARLAAMLFIALGGFLTGVATVRFFRSPSFLEKTYQLLSDRSLIFQHGFRIILYISLALLAAKPYINNNWLMIFERSVPIVIYLILFSLTLLIATRSVDKEPKTSIKILFDKYNFTILIITFFITILIATTKIGITPDTRAWNPAGPPIFIHQLIYLLVIPALFIDLFILFFRKNNLTHPIIGGLKLAIIDIMLFLALWGLAYFIWMSQPLQKHYFNLEPSPPNYEYYPYSDAAVYDIGGEQILLGQGVNNGEPTDKPLYMIFLAFLHNFGGDDYGNIIKLQVFFLAGIPAMLYIFGKGFHSRFLGVVVGGLFIIKEKNAIIQGQSIAGTHPKLLMTELFTAFFLVTLCLILFNWSKAPQENKHYAIYTGGILGLASLARLNSILLFPLLLFLIVYMYKGINNNKQTISITALYSLTFLFVFIPYNIYLFQTEGTFALLDKARLILNARYDVKAITSPGFRNLGYQGRIIPLVLDLDGDRIMDLSLFLQDDGRWYLEGQGVIFEGNANDIPVPADYDGDGLDDLAVFRPNEGRWYINERDFVPFGIEGDIPVPADYDGDGADDIAIYRPNNGRWYIHERGYIPFGIEGDIPVPADYDGDGADDIAIYRPSNGRWYIHERDFITFGIEGDIPVPADYDGDGADDIAVYRPSNGLWKINNLEDFSFGGIRDIPIPADYNGDGIDDFGVFRTQNRNNVLDIKFSPSPNRFYEDLELASLLNTYGLIQIYKNDAKPNNALILTSSHLTSVREPQEAYIFIPNHFAHNIVMTLFEFPTDLGLSVRSNVGLHPFWNPSELWAGQITIDQGLMILLNIFLLSIGLGTSIKVHKLAGLIPLMINFGYNFSNALARSSGSRYAVVTDWAMYFYFILGIIQVSSLILNSKPDLSQSTGMKIISSIKQFYKKYFPILVILGFILLGLLVPSLGWLIPDKYTAYSSTELINDISPNDLSILANSEIEREDIISFIENDSAAILLLGKGLYPTIGRLGNRISLYLHISQNHVPSQFLHFSLLSSIGNNSIVLPTNTEETVQFTNGNEIFVIGCDRELYIEALILIVHKENMQMKENFDGLTCEVQ